MPQAIQIETQSEQQRLALLCAQRAARRAGRELAFHRTEKALDQGSAPVEPSRKCSPHLGAHSMDAPSFLPAFGGDHALCPEWLSDVGMILSLSNSTSASTSPMRDLLGSRLDPLAGKFAQSFHGLRRAICDNRNW